MNTMSSELEPYAVFWRNEQRQTGVVWAEGEMEARRVAEQYGGVAAVTDEPNEDNWNLPPEDKHYLGRGPEDYVEVGS